MVLELLRTLVLTCPMGDTPKAGVAPHCTHFLLETLICPSLILLFFAALAVWPHLHNRVYPCCQARSGSPLRPLTRAPT